MIYANTILLEQAMLSMSRHVTLKNFKIGPTYVDWVESLFLDNLFLRKLKYFHLMLFFCI